MDNWPAVVEVRPEAEVKEQPAWEQSCGDAYERARLAHADRGFMVKNTVGPERPKVVEPPIPAGPDGRPDTEANVFVCPNCSIKFKSLVACRSHQRVEHGT
jgi:hypothetical protein